MKKYKSYIGLLVLLVGLLSSLIVAAQSLEDVRSLSRAGARQLAIKQIDEYQPSVRESIVDWMLWERERIYILQTREDWSGIMLRIDSYQDNLPQAFMVWAKTQYVKASLELGAGARARALLRSLIWGDKYIVDQEQFSEWRRLIVRSYLIDQQIEDASVSLLRYRQDYGDSHAQEKLLRARVLLRARRHKEAWQILQDVDLEWARALSLLAHLRAGDMMPEAIVKQVYKTLSNKEDKTSELAAIWWSIAVQATVGNRYLREQVVALEEALSVEQQYPDDELFALHAGQLWQAYQAWVRYEQWSLAEDVGDRYQRALAIKDSDPHKARALLASIALGAVDPALEKKAHDSLVDLLNDRLLQRLYRESGRYTRIDLLPAMVRYRLIDQALANSDLVEASALMMGLEQPPEGSGSFEWALRRARVLMLAGDIQKGADILQGLIDGQEMMDVDVASRLLQVIFDLQTLARHERALVLFLSLQPKVEDQQQQREILYWMADSQHALKHYELAGWFYLRSAILLNAFAMDPWAQTARFHAADALVLAGFIDDARQLYQGLLNISKDKGRRSMLHHKIQKLLLNEASLNTLQEE